MLAAVAGSRCRDGGPAAMRSVLLAVIVMVACALGPVLSRAAEAAGPQRVEFPGPDGQKLVGYLFRPVHQQGPRPAIVMLHGRAGPYSTRAEGVYDASTLSKRHVFWGERWAAEGYVALLVDSFGPRGYPSGFPAHSYDERPAAVSEVDVRPRDAYAGLAYLRTLPEVDGHRIALQGWSNGGSTALVTMADATLARQHLTADQGFRGAIAFYPACGLHGAFDAGYRPYAAVRVLSGDADEEVSASRCEALVARSRAAGSLIDMVIYPGATHDFDDPGRKRQSVEANALARDNARATRDRFHAGIVRAPIAVRGAPGIAFSVAFAADLARPSR